MFKFIFLMICFCLTRVFAQTLSNIDFFAEGKKVIITYDLSDCEPGQYYDVTLNFVEQSTLKVTVPKTISGDIKKITCGSKRIVWDIGADVSTLSGRFYPELEVVKANINFYQDQQKKYKKEIFKKQEKDSIDFIKDIDGNIYKIAMIGNQVWMIENLKTTRYNDGTSVQMISDSDDWSKNTIGAWCYYNNDTSYNSKFGKLYNWFSVFYIGNGNKGLCPMGWHIPTDSEWNILTEFLGGRNFAGGKMKEAGTIYWNNPNLDASNSSLFSGLPGGNRYVDGNFSGFGDYGHWWSSTENGILKAWGRFLDSGSGSIRRGSGDKRYGVPIRCVRN